MSWVKISSENNHWLDTDNICEMWTYADSYWIQTKDGKELKVGHPEWWYLLGMKEAENP